MNTKQLRQKILDLAIRGKLVPQDPNDEPASVLLERVRVEKERLVKVGKIKAPKEKASVDKSHYCWLPSGWGLISLGDICEMATGPFGTMISKKEHQSSGIPVLGIENIGYGEFFYGNKIFVTAEKSKELKSFSLQYNDIIVSRSGTVGELCLVPKDMENSLLSTNLMRIRLDNSIIPELFIRWLYSTYILENQIKEMCKGSTRVFLNQRILKSLVIPIPPLNEQRRILAAIESAFAVIDEIECNKADLQASVTAAKQKILSLAIRGKLVPQDPNDEPASALLERISTEKERLTKSGIIRKEKPLPLIEENEVPFDIPEGWQWARLGSIAFYKKGPFGSSVTKSMFIPDSDLAIKIYEQKNAINKDDTLGAYYISPEKFEELKGFEVFPNDIIVSCAGTIGETYVMPPTIRRGIINQALMRIMLYEKSMTDFYLMYFDFALKSDAQKHAKGTAIKNIPPFDVLKQFLIPLPPVAEQHRIVSAVEAAFGEWDGITAELI